MVGTEYLNVDRHVVQFYRADAMTGEADLFAEVCRLHHEVLGPGEPGAVRTFGYHRDAPAAALACRWGVESRGDAAKTVWVELRR